MAEQHRVVICGAGITGISAAYHLAKAGIRDILLVDELSPLSLTSDRSTECYRNWWPDPELRLLMDRSIYEMDQIAAETGNIIRMNRRGYLYVSADENESQKLMRSARMISDAGAGPLRIHSATPATTGRQAMGVQGSDRGCRPAAGLKSDTSVLSIS